MRCDFQNRDEGVASEALSSDEELKDYKINTKMIRILDIFVQYNFLYVIVF